MDDIISQTKADYIRTKKTLKRAIETTPDDRINWSPSDTSRSALALAAHAAIAVKLVHDCMDGRPFGITDPQVADQQFREFEREFQTREQVLDLLERNSESYIEWLDGLSTDRLQETFTLPFGLGTAPIAVGLPIPARHMSGHISQIEYIQSIYGDRDWHLFPRG